LVLKRHDHDQPDGLDKLVIVVHARHDLTDLVDGGAHAFGPYPSFEAADADADKYEDHCEKAALLLILTPGAPTVERVRAKFQEFYDLVGECDPAIFRA